MEAQIQSLWTQDESFLSLRLVLLPQSRFETEHLSAGKAVHYLIECDSWKERVGEIGADGDHVFSCCLLVRWRRHIRSDAIVKTYCADRWCCSLSFSASGIFISTSVLYRWPRLLCKEWFLRSNNFLRRCRLVNFMTFNLPRFGLFYRHFSWRWSCSNFFKSLELRCLSDKETNRHRYWNCKHSENLTFFLRHFHRPQCEPMFMTLYPFFCCTVSVQCGRICWSVYFLLSIRVPRSTKDGYEIISTKTPDLCN